MLPPEIQRIVLLIGLAAVGYLLILAWTEDMEAAKAPTVYSEAPLVSQQSPIQGEAQTTEDEFAAVDSDIPPETVVQRTQTATDTGRLVKVETPVLEVWVDLLGGDIARVQLPTYPISLEQPDTPFLLMDRSAGRTYIAQSALIGPDGIDKTGARPLYDVEKSTVTMASGGELVLTTTLEDAQVAKIFSFEPNSHLINIRYEVVNLADQPKNMRLLTQIKRDRLPPPTDETVPLAPSPYLGGALTTPDNNYEKVDFDDLDEGSFKAATVGCLLYTSPSPRDVRSSRMPSSA